MVTMLGYKLPDNWRDLMPNRGPESGEPAAEPPNAWGAAVAGLLGGGVAEIENAQRWIVKIVDDGDTCFNCRENDGKTYKNREEAYKDYPGGEGYVRCEGVQYGNACRCRVVKRRKGDDGGE